jgi:hypothetical protein
MASTNSLVTAVNVSTFDNWIADDGTTGRLRDGQTFIGTAFGNLSVPAGATIDGIIVEMEGYAAQGSHDGNVGDWIAVSNDGGTTFSTAQSVTTGLWSTSIGAFQVESAGGTSELWGMSWNATTANAIQVRMTWTSSDGNAVYLDYAKVIVHYTSIPIKGKIQLTSGKLQLNSGKINF